MFSSRSEVRPSAFCAAFFGQQTRDHAGGLGAVEQLREPALEPGEGGVEGEGDVGEPRQPAYDVHAGQVSEVEVGGRVVEEQRVAGLDADLGRQRGA